MASAQHAQAPAPAGASVNPTLRLGCVSFLNAKPLIDGLDRTEVSVHYAVPGRLLTALEQDQVDLALCPVIDYFRASRPLRVVPAGGIGCAGPTLTVRLFSRVPLDQLTAVHGDRDSHTSIVLMRVLLAERFGRAIEVIPYDAAAEAEDEAGPEAKLLIGDKVVTAAPNQTTYPYSLDLGEAWHEMTGLPFVFAIWLARPNAALGDWPNILDRLRQVNLDRLETIVQQHAPAHGWPIDLARDYLTRILRYEVGDAQLQAIRHFASLAAKHGLIPPPRELDVVALDTEPNQHEGDDGSGA